MSRVTDFTSKGTMDVHLAIFRAAATDKNVMSTTQESLAPMNYGESHWCLDKGGEVEEDRICLCSQLSKYTVTEELMKWGAPKNALTI